MQLQTRINLILFWLLSMCNQVSAQSHDWELDKMPKDLETDFALSALPLHLRADASIYLLDPAKGYYIAKKGSNGFICFVIRTEWERAQFRGDLYTPISFDAEGAKVIFPVYADAATMRASGKVGAQQLKDTIDSRIKKGIYKIPKPGISYMLGPLMRTFDEKNVVVTMCIPHYMFYAPYLTAADLGCTAKASESGPIVLGEGTSPHGFAIMMTGEKDKSKIVADHAQLLKRLSEYRPYLKIAGS
ncbi:MAG TPA: hypothetical protein VGQ59_20945 [Cyclobacteriaceae bacterium]|jgi:hypothetical protein|nr:hypothetical protein [Cyclobacteriaceae bacterium]